MRTPKQLTLDSRPFAAEFPAASWWCLLSTLAIYAAALTAAAGPWPWALRIAGSVVAGLTMVRLFIVFHDYEHGTILRKSLFAKVVMSIYGLLVLNPPGIWRRSHDHHHKNNSKINLINVGSFPIMTVREYHLASPSERIAYAITRHPLTLALGYFTVFLYGMCVRSFLANPRAHYDSALSIILHFSVMAWLGWLGWDVLLLAGVIPSLLSAGLGSYLFYAQHNFPSVKLKTAAQWDYVSAALQSSSYIEMSPVMHYFTGNIGYHHVHHLNHHIPFYRLPEAMAALEEMQNPGRTSLHPRDVIACLRLKLWDDENDCLVPFPRSAPQAVPAAHPPQPSLVQSVADAVKPPLPD
jgi:omega-6 fatty acid desaturase (delta-12 desaturase)